MTNKGLVSKVYKQFIHHNIKENYLKMVRRHIQMATGTGKDVQYHKSERCKSKL